MLVFSHSWPLVSRKYPELSEQGAYSPTQTYSSDDVKVVIAYANSIGIEVVLEIDTSVMVVLSGMRLRQLCRPGHTASIARSHPDRVACLDKNWTVYAAAPPTGQLR